MHGGTGLPERHLLHLWRGGITKFSDMSGIEQALWDIKGKELGRPVCELLGGPVRDQLRLYDHLGGGSLEGMYGTTEPEEFADRVQHSISQGFTAMKAMPIPVAELIESAGVLKHAERCVAAMRKAAGDNIDIMLDLHARTTPAAAIQFGRRLVDYDLYWYEEPCWPESIEGLAMINRELTTPVATGERMTHLSQFRDLFAARGCEICQLDLTHCGGFTEARRISALAEAHRIALAPHNPQGPVSTAASLEFGFSQPSYIICETVHNDVPWRQDVVSEGFTIEKAGRIVRPNSRPGLGIEINEKEVKKHPFEQEILQRVNHPDGSVGDW